MKNVLELASYYDAFFIDIWGVLHESKKVYPEAASHLVTLQQMRKTIILVSNAPRRSANVEKFLKEDLGFTKGIHYNEILTSGESFFIKSQSFEAGRVFYIGEPKDKNLILQIPHLHCVSEITKDIDFAAATSGQENEDMILQSLLFHKIPFFCLNPDLFIKTKDGKLEPCAGSLAKKYADQGGEVIYFGKPYSLIYEYAFDILRKIKPDIDKKRILAIGDGMETDIKGANSAQIDSALCLCGLPSFELQKGVSLEDFISGFSWKPTYFIKNL